MVVISKGVPVFFLNFDCPLNENRQTIYYHLLPRLLHTIRPANIYVPTGKLRGAFRSMINL